MAFIRSSENLTGTHIPGDSVDASREVFESIMTLRRRNVKKSNEFGTMKHAAKRDLLTTKDRQVSRIFRR